MELSRTSVDTAGRRAGLGRCRHFFWLGVAFDSVGVAVLFAGVFADLLFYDLLLYLGAIIIFVSLLWWISWYTGNIEMLPEGGVSRTHRPALAVEEARRGRGRGRRFSLPASLLASVSSPILHIRHIRRGHRCSRRIRQKVPAVPGPQGESGDSEPQDAGKENLDPKPEDHRVWPLFPLNQPEPSAALASPGQPVVPSCTSSSQPVICLSPQCYPLLPGASQSTPRFPVFSASHPQTSVDPHSQSGMGVSSQHYPLKRAGSQSHLLVPVDPYSQSGLSVSSPQCGSNIHLPEASRSQLQNPGFSNSASKC